MGPLSNDGLVPSWYKRERWPSHFNPANFPVRNMVISGVVGTNKTRFVKKNIYSAAQRYNILILDIHEEYNKYPKSEPKVSPRFISVEFLQKILDTKAAYLIDLKRYLVGDEVYYKRHHKRYDMNTFIKECDLSKAQEQYFKHSYRKVSDLLGHGSDIVDSVNNSGLVRIVINRDYLKEQLYLTLKQLINTSHRLNERGTIVIMEELEKLAEIDQSSIIEELIMAGRKHGIFLVLITHQTFQQMKVRFGPAFGQFDVFSYFTGGGNFELFTPHSDVSIMKGYI